MIFNRQSRFSLGCLSAHVSLYTCGFSLGSTSAHLSLRRCAGGSLCYYFSCVFYSAPVVAQEVLLNADASFSVPWLSSTFNPSDPALSPQNPPVFRLQYFNFQLQGMHDLMFQLQEAMFKLLEVMFQSQEDRGGPRRSQDPIIFPVQKLFSSCKRCRN